MKDSRRPKKCTVCETIMQVKRCLYERKKYCSLACRDKALRGTRLSQRTEFKRGSEPSNKKPVGTVTIRTRNRDGRSRRWIKIEDPNRWVLYCRYVWEREHGPIPHGLLIHHGDKDSLNDEIMNLEMMSRGEHIEIHRDALMAAKGLP